MMKSFTDFSTNSTEIELYGERIKKKIKLENGKPIEIIYGMILSYIEKIKKANIPLPKIYSTKIENNELIFDSKFQGYNLLQKQNISNPSEWYNKHRDKIYTIFSILKKAQDNKLDLDPHVKNFVINESGEIYYTDFFPPAQEDYYKLRLTIAFEEKEILEKFFKVYHYSTLGVHFFADLLKENNGFIELSQEFYNLSRSSSMFNGSHQEFLNVAEKIKSIELERVKRKISLF